jgi:hypothetical protein
MARRRRRKKGGMPDALVGTLLTVLGLVLIGGLAGAAWWIATRQGVDPITNCPLSGPQAVNLVIFDQSDPVSPQQAQRIRQTMQRLKAEAQAGDRFDIYSFEGTANAVLKPRLTMCRPPDANEWIANLAVAKAKFEKFGKDLDGIVDELLVASTKPSSPIIESLRAGAITSFGSLSPSKQVLLRVILFSDMIQHSNLYSHFSKELDFGLLAKSGQWPQLRPDLRGAETEIYYLLRPEAKRANGRPIQSNGHQLFWEQLIVASGGRPAKIESY